MRYFLSRCGGSIKVQGTCFSCEKCSAELQLCCTMGHSLLPDTSGSVPTSCMKCLQEITTENIGITVQQHAGGKNASGSCYDSQHTAKARLGNDAAAEGGATGCSAKSASQHDAQPDVDRAISSHSAVTDGTDIIESDESRSSEDDSEMCSVTGGIASSDTVNSAVSDAATCSSTLVDSSLQKPESRRTRKNRKKKEKKKNKASAAADVSSGAAAAKAPSGAAAATSSSGEAADKAPSGAAAATSSSGEAAVNTSSGTVRSIGSTYASTTAGGACGAEKIAIDNFPAPADSRPSVTLGNAERSIEPRDETLRKDEVLVTFEIVIPPSFCNDKPAAVCIEFYDKEKTASSHMLSYQRLSSTRNGWTTSVKLPRAKLWSVRYRYCTVDKDQRKVFEHIHRDDNNEMDLKRRLELRSVDCQNIRHLCQYDLAMLPKKYPKQSGNILKRFKAAVEKKIFNFDGHMSEQLFEDSLFGLECMLPDIMYCLNTHTMKGDDVITKIQRIVDCVLRSNIFFLNDTRKWTDKRHFTEAIGLLFCSQLENCHRFLDDEHNHKPELFSIYRIICVLIMLVIMHYLKHIHVCYDLESPAALMEHIDWRNVPVKSLLDEIRSNFRFDWKFYEVLGSFFNLLAEAGNASWLLGIPAYHALGRYNTSCKTLKHDRCPDYWGLDANLQRAVECFKRTVKESDIARLLDKLEYAFDQQPLSARSVIAALNAKTVLYALKECWRLPIDAYTPAVLYFRLYPVKKLEYEQSQDLARAFESLLTYIERRLVQLMTSTSETAHQEVVISLEILSTASIELGQKLTPDHWDCAVAFVHLVVRLYRSAIRDSSTEEVCASTRRTIVLLVRGLTGVQQRQHYSSIPANELKMWEELHTVTWPDSAWQEDWTVLLNRSLGSRVDQISGQAKIDLYCNADSRNSHVKKILAAAACSAAEIVLKDPNIIKTDATDVQKFTRYGWLLSIAFADSWKKNKTDAAKILFMLQSPIFRTCYAFSRDARCSALEAECQECLTQCVSLFEDLARKLKDGRLTHGIVGLLMKHRQSFLEVHELLSRGESSADEEKYSVSFCLEHHRREKEQFDELRSNLVILQALCQDLENVRIQEFDKLNEDFLEMEIRLLWRPAVTESGNMSNSLDCDLFKVVRSTITPPFLAKVKHVYRSVIFKKIWKEAYEIHARYDGETDRKYGDEEVIAVVLSNAQEQWQAFADRFAADSATFQDASRLLQCCGNNLPSVEREISILVGTSKGEAAGKLLQQYLQLLQCYDGAKAILLIKDRLRLTGDFNIVDFIVNMKQNEECKLSLISEVLQQVALQHLPELCDACNARCLVELAACMDLVLWVKEHISNPKELKVFVDLASIAAGEGDIEVEKVSCLHASITGFSPLIYELQPRADLNAFLEKCHTVWRNLKSNPSLPDQLKATNENIHWVQHIKDSYGSVEVSSLAQASAINESGIFEVGCIHDSSGANSFSLEGVMRVTVPPAAIVKTRGLLPTNAGSAKWYGYSQLCELQSKLMLVAGKAEQDNPDVHKFVKMFDNATRLANAYINMHNTGNILFDTWKARFYCGDSQSVNVHVEFGLAKKVIRGLSDIPCEDHAMQLAKFLEQCIEAWKDYAVKKRKLFPELNFFTTKQIVFLRRELAKLLHRKTCDPKIYPLLSMVRPCDREDVLNALDEAADAMMVAHTIAVPENQQEADAQAAENHSEPVLSEEQQSMLNTLLDFDINKELAVTALAACPGCSITDIVQWCQDKGVASESALTASKPVTSKSNPISRERRSAETVHSMPSLLSEILVVGQEESFAGGVCALLTEIWSRYLHHASTSLNDFLSLDHLGHVLRLLRREKVRMKNRRKTPSGMNRGRIYLATCPQDAMLLSVMAVYAVDGRCPLPTRNEVLLCTAHTATEEVGLFLERASTDDNSIYTLAYADRLNYEACTFIERRVGDLQDCRTEYLIVVLCCEEKSLSPITTILERWKLNSGIVCDKEHIRKYVRQRLRVGEESRRVAAMLDNEQSSIRLIKSQRAGVGKSLYVQRTVQRLKREVTSHADPPHVYIPLLQQRASPDVVLEYLLPYSCPPGQRRSRIIHFDVTPEVQEGVNELLFDLLILGSVCQEDGYVWQRSFDDYYMVEFTSFQPVRQSAGEDVRRRHHEITELLPSVECYSPLQCLEQYKEVAGTDARGILMDDGEFRSRTWQRVYQHLTRFDGDLPFTDVDPSHPEGTHQQMLETLLKHCGIKNPSWAELKYFVLFLNRQLEDCALSSFCSKAAANELPGFIKFVVKFMLQMSKDFATRSLIISEESPHMKSSELQQTTEPDIVHGMTLKRRWEQSSHPYLFFNSDGHTLTFLGFCVDPSNGNIIEPKTRKILENGVMTRMLFEALRVNKVDLSEDFEKLSRQQQILKLCSIMGNPGGGDPDGTYKLTLDNVKKLLAIYMRFRCGIPVVIMGETGCGKTRLVKFMCGLQQPKGSSLRNLLLVKIHGGVTFAQLKSKVAEAYRLAQENRIQCPHMYTVLFLDEANTTDAIGLIKEVMCDGSLDGHSLDMTCGLRIVAAVNPYRKHPDSVIKKLESAGLGYYVRPEDTADRFGSIPMRQLVYRVRSLPPSILPLVWDFGQLSAEVEKIYILQMVEERARNFASGLQKNDPRFAKAVADVLVQCQKFMRAQEDECCFVSLRDADRALHTMSWFLEKCKFLRQNATHQHGAPADNAEDLIAEEEDLDDLTWSFVLALGVCYQACLLPQSREEFQFAICPYFLYPLLLPGGERQFSREIEMCQTLVIDSLSDHIPNNIARNRALKENILMMVVCMELRIPLFLIGKPGSSKSLAKAILADAMQGDVSKSGLFKQLKQTHMVSFQCSPLATPEGIVGTFKQAARFQKSRRLDKFVSVVVLDEIGLAEDSKLMPLKTLHPLLEDGCEGDEEPKAYMKCAFIGISNWALDPAKMNRGIMVQRGVPTRKELEESARGICKFDESVLLAIAPVIPSLAAAYLELFTEVAMKREFFGLRDFYSLMKMVAYFANHHGGMPHPYEFQHAVRRNFGGSYSCNAVEVFEKHLETRMDVSSLSYNEDYPPCDAIGLIRSSLNGEYTSDGGESRYLLILTENYSVLNLIQGEIQKMNPQIIFGSSFPKDLLYTQVCRNINRIKVCMETGTPVMLLNLEHLYESLYDALNQYYVYYGGKRFVDLGLGTHRVKCRVHERFRLIVVARKDDVHNKYPIPLINRLEKHYISMNTMLTSEQKDVVKQLDQWAIEFTNCSSSRLLRNHQRSAVSRSAHPRDVFVGLAPDTSASLVIKVTDEIIAAGSQPLKEEVRQRSEQRLLSLATPESVLRIKGSFTEEEYNRILEIYFKEQQHDCLLSFFKKRMLEDRQKDCFLQVTTRSKLLSEGDVNVLGVELNRTCFVDENSVELIAALQAMDTEHQFSERVRNFFRGKRQPSRRAASTNGSNGSLLIIQCEAGGDNLKLVECARHILSREYNAIYEEDGDTGDHRERRAPMNRHVVLVIQVSCRSSFSGFYGGIWECVHIDDLRPPSDFLPDICEAQRNPLSQLLNSSLQLMRRCSSENSSGRREEFDGNDKDMKRLDIVELLKMCLHEAASRLRDSSPSNDRPQERIRSLCELLSADGSLEFSQLVASSIVELFRAWEHATSHQASHWLVTDAAAEQNIVRLGTFRRSLEDCLARKIAPAFASVIAYCDVNDGLDLVDPASDSYEPWVASLWLKIFASFCLSGSSMMTSFPEQCPLELPVLCKSATGQAFKSRFPFSWVIKEKFDALSKQAATTQGTQDVLESWLASDEEFGDHIRVLSKEQLQESICRYAHDYLYMTHQCRDREEYELILSAFLRSMRSAPLSNIADVHSYFSANRPAIVRWNRLMDATLTSTRAEILAHMRRAANDEDPLWDTHAIDVMGLREVLRVLEKKSYLESKPCGKSNPAKEWSSSVHRLQSITKEILTAAQDLDTYSNSCVVNECRRTWSRLEAVRLFVEYIVVPEASRGSSPAFEMKHAKLLLMALCEDKDFNPKTLSSFVVVEKFLTFCHSTSVTAIYGKDAARRKCYSCNATLTRAVLLPCRHLVCSPCLHRFYQLNNQLMKCPQCRQTVQFGEAAVPANEHDRESYERLKQLMQRLSDLFIRLLSDLVFDGVNRPEEPLLRHLLSYIIVSQDEANAAVAVDTNIKALTTQLSICIDASLVDPRPVVRSLLLQLILQSSQGEMDVVATFFEKATAIAKQDTPTLDAELCTIFINCIEDYYYRQVHFVDHDNGRDSNDSTMSIGSTLRRGTAAWQVFNEKSAALTVETLSSLAKVRLALALVAGVLCQQILSKSFTSSTREVVDVLRQFCDHAERHAGCPWPRIFLAKHMIRKRGASTVLGAMAEPSLRQLMPRELQEAAAGDTLSDPFVIGNNNELYCAIRKALSACIIDGKPDDFDRYLRDVKAPDSAVDMCMILAICSVITRTYYSSNADGLPKPQTINMLRGLIQACPRIRSKELCEHVLKNSLPEKLRLAKDMGLPNAMIALLVLRLWAVLSNVSQRNSLLVPLSMLLSQPRAMQGKFFPTMPHDQFQDIRHVMQAMVQPGENLIPYACPNGHIYYIGNCGRAYSQRQCPDCESNIGGAQHVLSSGNRRIDPQEDQTKPGHILGPVTTKAHQQNLAVAERDLTPASCCIARILLHIAMYASSARNGPQHVSLLVAPTPPDIFDFLWKHICNDLNTMERTLNKSRDECVILLHTVIAGFVDHSTSGNFDWDTQERRRQWEVQLHQKVIAPCIQNCNEIISAATERLQTDAHETGSTVALAKLLEEPNQPLDVGSLLSNSVFWRYRERPGLDHFLSELENYVSSLQIASTARIASGLSSTADRYAYLLKFLRSHELLAAVSHLPAVMATIALLHQEFSRKLSTHSMDHLSIESFLATPGRSCSHSLEPIIKHFIDAWNAVRVNLVNHRFWFDGQQFLLPSEVCSVEMSYRSPIKMLLTGYRGFSLCPLALVTYLAKTHNDLLAAYAQAFNEEISSKVALNDAKVVHLITTGADTTLLSIILANCEYSLKVGEGTAVHYNYDAIQQQIVERLVQHKPLLLIPSAKSNEGELRRFLFHEDLTNGYKLEQLSKILQQERLSAEQKNKLCSAYRSSVTDLSDSLSFVDQVIGFLITTRTSPDAFLCSYARDCLRMNYNSYKHGALENLLVKHVRSLWLLLSMERSRVLIAHHLSANRASMNIAKSEDYPWQTWFGDVSSRYAEGLTSADSGYNEMLEHMRRLHRNRVARSVLEILYEFIALRLSYSADRRSDVGGAAPETDEDDWYPVHYGLFPTLAAYAETFESPYQPGDDDTVTALGQLSDSCPQLQLRHAVLTWIILNCIVNNEI